MKRLSKKDKEIVADFVAVFTKYKHLGSRKLAQLIRKTFEYEYGI